MFKKLTRTVAMAMVMAVGALSLPADASAGDRGYRHYGGGHGKHFHSRRHHHGGHRGKRHRNNNAGAAVAAGIIGLTIGTIIGSSASRPYYQPRHVYRQRQPVYQPVRQYAAAPRPYTGEWYRYCAGKYRSFDAQSGTFLSYSGVRKLCR